MVTNREIRNQIKDLKSMLYKSDLEFSFFLSVRVDDIDPEVFDSAWYDWSGEKELHQALSDAVESALKGQGISFTLDISEVESELEANEEKFDHLDDTVTAQITSVSANR
jgi:hypothetical protein